MQLVTWNVCSASEAAVTRCLEKVIAQMPMDCQ
jgi:hypothetical protein